MAEYAKAQRVYDEIAQADPRQRLAGMIPQAEMVYFELGDQARGQALIAEALSQQDINARERFNVIVKCARAALADGQRELALRWFARADKLPVAKTHEKQQFLSQAWFEMGRIEESRGRLDAAKKLYRQAMQLPDGNMQLRVRARDALESIQYFE